MPAPGIAITRKPSSLCSPSFTPVDLEEVTKQLVKAKAVKHCKRRSVRSDERKGPRPTVEERRGRAKVQLLLLQYREGATRQELADRYEISLRGVGRLLQRHDPQQLDRAPGRTAQCRSRRHGARRLPE